MPVFLEKKNEVVLELWFFCFSYHNDRAVGGPVSIVGVVGGGVRSSYLERGRSPLRHGGGLRDSHPHDLRTLRPPGVRSNEGSIATGLPRR